MWKAIVAGTAALAIAGTSLVYAQQRGGRDGMMMERTAIMREFAYRTMVRHPVVRTGTIWADRKSVV